MDKIKAKDLERVLKGNNLNGYKILGLLNNGKSAAVFKGEKEGQEYAIKVFDNELVERFGHEIQVKRIELEITLKNHSIKNLIKIFDGGSTTYNDQQYYFIIMELIDGLNLKDFIKSKDYDEKLIKNVASKLFFTTEELLIKEIVHRDIKPENIMIDENNEITLMDLGVLKLIGAQSFSDEEEKQFVGTLRYSPPEFLLRIEKDTMDGWRAVNLYQIGAVLHDLIMKRELFIERTPYSNLVIAIKDDVASIRNSEYSFDLLQLTRDLLIKDYRKRLDLCSEERVKKILVKQESNLNEFDNSLEQIYKMQSIHRTKFEEIDKLRRDIEEIRANQKKFANTLSTHIDNALNLLQSKNIFKKYAKSEVFLFDTDKNSSTELIIQNYLYEIFGDLKMGFPQSLFILVRLSNDETNYSEIELLGIFTPIHNKLDIMKNPVKLFKEIADEKKANLQPNKMYMFETYNIFKGNIEFDQSFIELLKTKLAKLILKALELVEKYVNVELQILEKSINSKNVIISKKIPETLMIIDET